MLPIAGFADLPLDAVAELLEVADGTRTHDDRNHNPYTFSIYFNDLERNSGIYRTACVLCGAG